MVNLVKELVTTFLDTIGLMLLAVGSAAFLFRYLHWGCLVVAGIVVLLGSWVASRESKAKDR